MNESILINNSVLRLPQLMRKRKREKDEEKALPLSFYGALSILWLCSAIRRCVSLSLLLSLPLCVSSVCVCARAYQRPFSLFWEPRWFRSDTAQPERTLARRSALPGRLRYPAPLHLCFFFTPLPSPLYRDPLYPDTHSTNIHTHIHIHIHKEKHTVPPLPLGGKHFFSAHTCRFIGTCM